MENEDAKLNPAANQLPEADSLPDGFVDSSGADSLAPETPNPEQEKPPAAELTNYKEDKLEEPEMRPGLNVNDSHFDPPAVNGCRETGSVGGEEQAKGQSLENCK